MQNLYSKMYNAKYLMFNVSCKISHAKFVWHNLSYEMRRTILSCITCLAKFIIYNVLCRTHEYASFIEFDMFCNE